MAALAVVHSFIITFERMHYSIRIHWSSHINKKQCASFILFSSHLKKQSCRLIIILAGVIWMVIWMVCRVTSQSRIISYNVCLFNNLNLKSLHQFIISGLFCELFC